MHEGAITTAEAFWDRPLVSAETDTSRRRVLACETDEMSTIAVEICAQSPADAQVAVDVGADRIELCTALEVGGLTPSIGSIRAARALTERPGWLHVLIRPRPGGYLYSAAEVDLTCADIAAAIDAGADGVVVGALRADHSIDADACEAFVAAANGGAVTFHRAFGLVPDAAAGLEQLAGLGFARILTSGAASRAVDAAAELASLVTSSAGRVEIMAGGGVQPEHIPALAAAGVDAVHLSAKRPVAGDGGQGAGGYSQTDPEVATAAMAALAAM